MQVISKRTDLLKGVAFAVETNANCVAQYDAASSVWVFRRNDDDKVVSGDLGGGIRPSEPRV